MSASVYVSNTFLKPMLTKLDKEWAVYGSWDSVMNKESVIALATTVWDDINEAFMRQFPNLKIVCHLGIGTDNLDKEYIKKHDITLLSQPQAGIHDTSELALTLMLSLARKIIPNHLYAKANHWIENKPRFLGNNLLGKRLGLVGYGQIGQRIAKFASALDMTISYTARSNKNNEYHYYPEVTQLARNSDFLVLCCAGGQETQHIINAEVLEALGTDGYLINVARGSVVDQEALISALNNKRIAGAGLDVFCDEPAIPSTLRDLENVILSPHMGSSTHENLQLMYQLQANQLNQFLLNLVAC